MKIAFPVALIDELLRKRKPINGFISIPQSSNVRGDYLNL